MLQSHSRPDPVGQAHGEPLTPSGFLRRSPRAPLPAAAKLPRSLRGPSTDEAERGVVIGYSGLNFTIYRGVVDRLQDGERLRIEARESAFELTSDELLRALAAAVSTPSYLTGTTSVPGGCYYTWSAGAPPSMERFRVGRRTDTPGVQTRSALHRYMEELLVEAEILTLDAEGITLLDGQRAPLRATRSTSAEVGWECEVEIDGRRTGERRLADVYLVAEIAPDANDIVRLRAWDADSVRPLLTGKPSHDRGNPGWTHGLRLNLIDPQVHQLARDLTPRLW